MTEIRPFLLENTVQHYAWGTRNAEAFIPNFLGIEPEHDVPYAELWIGAHPKAPSSVQKNNERLALIDFIGQAPRDILGARAAERFNDQLPFLLKVLSAGEPLSIQTHPNKAQAGVLHARDPKNYPDDNHKPEIAVALTELTALAGFKPFAALAAAVSRLAPLAELAGADKASKLILAASQSEEAQHDALKEFFRALMTRALGDEAALVRAVDSLDRALSSDASAGEEAALFREFRTLYRYDVGLLSMLLMNIVHLKKGEGIFLGPGIPHAYIRGAIVECMANSDNVVRAGLTPKLKDVETLCEILTYECGMPEILTPSDAPNGTTIYPSPVAEFSLQRRTMNESDSLRRAARRSLEILVVIEGSISISQANGRQLFKQGDTVLIPAALAQYELTAHTHAEVFFASIPD
jgi:mannose-6-phosphate isomerase